MEAIFVTGASGQVGANICRIAAERGYKVRALVRNANDARDLQAVGAEPFTGDILDTDSLDRGMRGMDWVIHGAAQISGKHGIVVPEQAFIDINQTGAINVMAAAERAGNLRMVTMSTGAILERTETITEKARINPLGAKEGPYTRTKKAAFYEAMARACRGQDIRIVFPGSVFGPSPCVERAVIYTSFTGTLLMALRGEVKRMMALRTSWVYADDVAKTCLAALEKGQRGLRYMGIGRPEDCNTPAGYCNKMLELAGVKHRVEDVPPEKADFKEFGEMANLVQKTYPEPPANGTWTFETLGVYPTAIDEAVRITYDWLCKVGKWSQ